MGLLKPRLFRPFPAEEMAEALKKAKVICVLDRAETFGGEGGPLYLEVKSAVQGRNNAKVVNRIFGLGQRDFLPQHVYETYEELKGESITRFGYINVRE